MHDADLLCSMHDVAPVTSGINEEVVLSRHGRAGATNAGDKVAQQERVVRKWSQLWRSIILSSLNKTVFPYCRYIRALNFRDLGHLLEDPKFRGKIARYLSNSRLTKNAAVAKCFRDFFKDDLATFHHEVGKGGRLNVIVTIETIGEGLTPLLDHLFKSDEVPVVTQQTPNLEDLSGHRGFCFIAVPALILMLCSAGKGPSSLGV